MLKREVFIERANLVHNGRYDYSKVEYNGMMNNITIICKEHGEFVQKANNHISGQSCPACSQKSRVEKNSRSLGQFIKKSILAHGNKYDYSKVEYKNSFTKVTIVCPQHGEFIQAPVNHLRGYGCKKCGIENRRSSN